MTRKAQIFVGTTIAVGGIVLAASLAGEGGIGYSGAYLAYCLLAIFASALKIHLPKITGTISVNFLFILIAMAAFTFVQTLLLASFACIIQCLWRARRRPRIVQVCFNVSALLVSSGIAYRASHAIGKGREPNLAVLLTVAASLYFTANTLLISGVVSLVEGKSLFDVWRQCYLWCFPYYLAGAAVAGLAVTAGRALGWAMSLPILPCMYLIYVFYRMCVERLGRAATADLS